MHTCIDICIHAYIHASMHTCMATCTQQYLTIHICDLPRQCNLTDTQVDKLFWIATGLGPHTLLKSFIISKCSNRKMFHDLIVREALTDGGKEKLDPISNDYSNLEAYDPAGWQLACTPAEDTKSLGLFYIRRSKQDQSYELWDKTNSASRTVAGPCDAPPKVTYNVSLKRYELSQHGISHPCIDVFLNPESSVSYTHLTLPTILRV